MTAVKDAQRQTIPETRLLPLPPKTDPPQRDSEARRQPRGQERPAPTPLLTRDPEPGPLRRPGAAHRARGEDGRRRGSAPGRGPLGAAHTCAGEAAAGGAHLGQVRGGSTRSRRGSPAWHGLAVRGRARPRARKQPAVGERAAPAGGGGAPGLGRRARPRPRGRPSRAAGGSLTRAHLSAPRGPEGSGQAPPRWLRPAAPRTPAARGYALSGPGGPRRREPRSAPAPSPLRWLPAPPRRPLPQGLQVARGSASSRRRWGQTAQAQNRPLAPEVGAGLRRRASGPLAVRRRRAGSAPTLLLGASARAGRWLSR